MQTLSYDEWMAEVNELVEDRYGLSYSDFPDLLFTKDAYDDGFSPEEFFEDEVVPTFDEEFGGIDF